MRRLRWPCDHRESVSHGNFLHAVDGVRDHAASDPAAGAKRPSPKFLAGGGIQRVEIAPQITEEHDASGRRSHGADDGVVGLDAPFPDPGVGVAGINPSGPVSVGRVFLSEHVDRVPRRHSGPWLPDGYRPQPLVILDRHGIAPVDGTGDDEIRRRIEARGVPFSAAHRTRAEMHVLADGESALGILDRGYRHAVEQVVRGEIVAIEVPILRATDMSCLPPMV